ncbi:hypothetical protein [Thioclava sp.]|uniref:hypothetical protein n=1 Tax=Thioclava sp. TaxID=1933450 RepID=UPI003AA8F4EB
MSLVGALIWIGSTLIAIVSFLLGKAFSQSEKVLDQKRKAYEDFLRVCPAPNEAHSEREPDIQEVQRAIGILSVYGSQDVLTNASEYFQLFASAQEILSSVTEAGHPEFMSLMTRYNRMILAMREDAMRWSAFAPNKKNREYKLSQNLNQLK